MLLLLCGSATAVRRYPTTDGCEQPQVLFFGVLELLVEPKANESALRTGFLVFRMETVGGGLSVVVCAAAGSVGGNDGERDGGTGE